MFTRRWEVAAPTIVLEKEEQVLLSSFLKHLGIHLENKGAMFSLHLRTAADKVTRVMSTLSGFIPNVKGPSESKRRPLGSVVQFILLYGAPSWGGSLVNNARNTTILARVQRWVAWSPVPFPLTSLLRKGSKPNLLAGRPTGARGELNNFGLHGTSLRTRALTMERWIQRFEIASLSVGSSPGNVFLVVG